MTDELKNEFREMLFELEEQHLEVVLIPQKDPGNVGACNRAAISSNPDWYRDLCSRYESQRKDRLRYRKFKTKIKRRSVLQFLSKLSFGIEPDSKYVDDLKEIAKYRILELKNEEVPF